MWRIFNIKLHVGSNNLDMCQGDIVSWKRQFMHVQRQFVRGKHEITRGKHQFMHVQPRFRSWETSNHAL